MNDKERYNLEKNFDDAEEQANEGLRLFEDAKDDVLSELDEALEQNEALNKRIAELEKFHRTNIFFNLKKLRGVINEILKEESNEDINGSVALPHANTPGQEAST